VRVLDDLTIKLFATKAQAEAGPASFNPATAPDVVTADNFIHLAGFTNGDAVTYYAPAPTLFSSLLVDTDGESNTNPATQATQPLRTVDNDRIFLGRDMDGDGTNDAGSGYANGDRVTYRTSGTAIGGLTNNTIYYTLAVDANSVQLVARYVAASITFDQRADDTDRIIRNDVGGNWATDGFAAGQEIVITGAGNPTNNKTLTIASVDGATIFIAGDQLADETHTAVVRSQVLSLTPDKTTDGLAVRHALARQPLGSLDPGTTYYVINSDAAKFQLAAAPMSSTVLGVSDAGRSGVHAFGRAGVELTPSSGQHQLALDLDSRPSGSHRLIDPSRQNPPPAGDGQASSSTQGGSGGVGAISVPTSTTTTNPTVTARVAADLIDAGGAVTISSNAVANLTSTTTNFGIGGVAAGEVDATANATVKSLAAVGDEGVVIRARGAFKLLSDSSITTRADAIATLRTESGAILDANVLSDGVDDPVNVRAAGIRLDANGGSIGTAADALEIDSGPNPSHWLAAEASGDIAITETDGPLRVLLVKAFETGGGGNVQLTVRESAALDEHLILHRFDLGVVRFSEIDVRALATAQISALGSVTLLVGDDATVAALGEVLAGQGNATSRSGPRCRRHRRRRRSCRCHRRP
jgi:hypothetical protein